jgi:hypothetical protein
MGELALWARREFQAGIGVKLPSPTRIHPEAARSAMGIDLSLAGTYENEEQAKEFSVGLVKVNRQAIEALEKLPEEKLPAEVNKLLRTTLGTFQIDAKGKTVNLRSQVPAELIKALPDLLIRTITLEKTLGGPVKVIEEKGASRRPEPHDRDEARLWLTTFPAAIPCLHETRHAA